MQKNCKCNIREPVNSTPASAEFGETL
jgi:hypothetical protein